jgi:type IV pilus assembly protein PilM
MAKTIVGLDFGHGVIRAAEVSAGGGKRRPVLHRYHEVEVPTDAIKEGVVADEASVVAALRWLWAVSGFTTKRVVIGMGSQQVLIRELILPAMPMKHLRETLPFRVQDLLPLPVEAAVLDFCPIESVDHEGEPHLRGLLVAATRESVLLNARAAEAAGLRPVDVDLIPFAIIRALAQQHATGTSILAHVGAVSTSIVVTQNGRPQFVRMLPTGGSDLTAALSEQLGVRPDRADELKRRIGLIADPSDPQTSMVAEISAENARDVLQAIRSTIGFFENSRPEAHVDGVVLSGGGALLRGLVDEIARGTGLPVSIGDAGSSFHLGSGVDEASFLAAGTGPTVALGLTMRSAA